MFRNFSFAKLCTRHAELLSSLLVVTVALGTNACSRYTRTKQCRALIAQVNPALDDVLTVTHGGGAGGAGGGAGAGASGVGGVGGSIAGTAASSGYVAAAGRYERLAKQLGPMEFGSEEMAKLVAEYAGVLNSAAETLRSLAAALESNNNNEAERLNRELERITVHERSLVARMDAWCQP